MTSNQLSSPLFVKCMEERRNNSVDQACVEIFVTKNKPKKGSASPNQIQAKKLHSSIILPCCKVLHQKIKRYIYVASIWTNSLRLKPTPHLPLSFVLMLDEDGTYCIKWFEGDVAPKIVEVVKDDSCTCYGEFFNSKIQRRLLQNNANTNFNHSAFFLISSNQKLFFQLSVTGIVSDSNMIILWKFLQWYVMWTGYYGIKSSLILF